MCIPSSPKGLVAGTLYLVTVDLGWPRKGGVVGLVNYYRMYIAQRCSIKYLLHTTRAIIWYNNVTL